jgi:hypothetical protein
VISADQIVAHLVGDYILQSDWMANEKTKRSVAALAHVLCYSLPFLFFRPSLAAWAFIGVTHFVIDRWRLARWVVYFKNWLAPWTEFELYDDSNVARADPQCRCWTRDPKHPFCDPCYLAGCASAFVASNLCRRGLTREHPFNTDATMNATRDAAESALKRMPAPHYFRTARDTIANIRMELSGISLPSLPDYEPVNRITDLLGKIERRLDEAEKDAGVRYVTASTAPEVSVTEMVAAIDKARRGLELWSLHLPAASDYITNAAATELELRREWWLNHRCPISALYGDDGEMQCNAQGCMKDFKREPLDLLMTHVRNRRLAFANTEMTLLEQTRAEIAEMRAFTGPKCGCGHYLCQHDIRENTMRVARRLCRKCRCDSDPLLPIPTAEGVKKAPCSQSNPCRGHDVGTAEPHCKFGHPVSDWMDSRCPTCDADAAEMSVKGSGE